MKCSEKLFGYNLECTRRLGYGGLYAEMIHNGRVLCDAEGFYPVECDGLKGLGQCAERIQFHSGRTYEWNILAGDQIIVRILNEFGDELCRSEKAKGSYTSQYNWQHARFEVCSDQPIRYISLKPSDAWHECRKDVLDAIKELHPTTIRVPGGCFSDVFDWKDGLLPIEERQPMFTNDNPLLFSAHCGYDGYELNIDDYAAICRYAGAEMELTVRMTSSNPQEAADLVEYCNGDVSTKYGALRASRGYVEPYNVRTWYVGNEVASRYGSDWAAEMSDRYVEAMRKVDSTIRTVVTTGLYLDFEDWDAEFLEAAKHVDMCSQHVYLAGSVENWDHSSVLNAAETVLLEILERANVRYKGREMLLDEWNLRWGCLGDSDFALYAAGVITLLIRNAEKLNIAGASYFALVNEGAIRVYPDHVCLAPDGEVLKRMVNHAGGTVELSDDKTYIKTIHDTYSYISVFNNSANEEKQLSGIEGVYEILTPNGIWMNVEKGEGTLKTLPPASVAFIRRNL